MQSATMYLLPLALYVSFLLTFLRGEVIDEYDELVCSVINPGYHLHSGIKQLVGDEPIKKRSAPHSSVLSILLQNADDGDKIINYNVAQKLKKKLDGDLESLFLSKDYEEPNSEGYDLPWICGCKTQIYDLGLDVIPRYISGAVCPNKTCWYEHYRCIPITTEETILVKHYGMCVDSRLPDYIGDKYMMYTVSVQVGAQCGLP